MSARRGGYARAMRRIVLALFLCASTAALAQQADDEETPPTPNAAQSSKPQPPSDDETPPSGDDTKGNLNLGDKQAAEGKYKGVAPGATALPPRAPRMPVKRGPQRMTWSGFQVRNGVPTVFVETTSLPEYRVEDAPGSVTVTLKHTVVPLRNNRRPLDVSKFDTDIKEVATQPKGHDVKVTITTKGNERPQHHERVEEAAGGFRMLVIELPPAK